MKKIIALVVLILLFLPSAAVGQTLAQGESRVFDQAGLMSQSDIQALETAIAAMRRQYGMDFVILTSDDARSDRSQEFADDFYDNNGFGAGENADGFLFFIDMNNRVGTVSTTGLTIRYVTDARLNTLLDAVYPYLSGGEFGKAAQAALSQVTTFLNNGIPENQYNQDEYGVIDRYRGPRTLALAFWEIAIAAGAGLMAALILYFSVRHRYLMKGSAYSYDLTRNASVTITGATDVYLRTAVTRTPKASSTSGGGGLGGRSSTHRSSSGRSHGGGSGRRF